MLKCKIRRKDTIKIHRELAVEEFFIIDKLLINKKKLLLVNNTYCVKIDSVHNTCKYFRTQTVTYVIRPILWSLDLYHGYFQRALILLENIQSVIVNKLCMY